MNSILNNSLFQKNIQSFEHRFPHLAPKLKDYAKSNQFKIEQQKNIEVLEAKNNMPTLRYNGKLLHSLYNPQQEAGKLPKTTQLQQAETIVFFGAGLGYAPVCVCNTYHDKNIVIIEPNPSILLHAFSLIDWEVVWQTQSCVFLLEATEETCITILEHFGLFSIHIIAQPNIVFLNQHYFTNIKTLLQRNRDKQHINERTLERFSKRWLSNMSKNIPLLPSLGGIIPYQNKAHSLPACVLAAGPGLDENLTFLNEIKKRCIIICTDTALRAALANNVQPHFILLTDPQYLNARHLEGLSAPESILITEMAVYPSIFRFKCKKILLFSSLFPLGVYIEEKTFRRGTLKAGGSVSTTAWDFARFIGCSTIFMIGLDLGFPLKKTHARFSTFEEKTHTIASRIRSAETQATTILYNTQTSYAQDMNGNPILTDERMKLYGWWFESQFSRYPNTKTFTLSKTALKIPLIQQTDIHVVLNLQNKEKEIKTFILNGLIPLDLQKETLQLHNALTSLHNELIELENIVQSGLALCKKKHNTVTEYQSTLKKLTKIDIQISKNKGSKLAELIFPPQTKLEEALNKIKQKNTVLESSFEKNVTINLLQAQTLYELILKSIKTHKKYLNFLQ